MLHNYSDECNIRSFTIQRQKSTDERECSHKFHRVVVGKKTITIVIPLKCKWEFFSNLLLHLVKTQFFTVWLHWELVPMNVAHTSTFVSHTNIRYRWFWLVRLDWISENEVPIVKLHEMYARSSVQVQDLWVGLCYPLEPSEPSLKTQYLFFSWLHFGTL